MGYALVRCQNQFIHDYIICQMEIDGDQNARKNLTLFKNFDYRSEI